MLQLWVVICMYVLNKNIQTLQLCELFICLYLEGGMVTSWSVHWPDRVWWEKLHNFVMFYHFLWILDWNQWCIKQSTKKNLFNSCCLVSIVDVQCSASTLLSSVIISLTFQFFSFNCYCNFSLKFFDAIFLCSETETSVMLWFNVLYLGWHRCAGFNKWYFDYHHSVTPCSCLHWSLFTRLVWHILQTVLFQSSSVRYYTLIIVACTFTWTNWPTVYFPRIACQFLCMH